MMRLTYSILEEPLEFKENIVNVIVLESPKCFREFVFEVKKTVNKETSGVFLSKDYEEAAFDKYVHVVFSVENIDINNKKILSKVYSEVKEMIFSENLYLKTMAMQSQTLVFMEEILHCSEINLKYEELDFDAFLKAMNLQIETEEKNFLSLICDYIDAVNHFFKTNIFLFFHLKEYLEKEELIELYRHCNYRKIHLCLCENIAREALPDEKLTIIDQDLCQIT